MFSNRPRPVVLVIMDGVGVAPPGPGNAVKLAKTPNLDSYWPNYAHGYLHASGGAVGLPHGTKGNSEVGHMNIGAGRVVFQELPRINTSITNMSFYDNQSLKKAADHVKQNGGKLHIMGLTSTGNVHSSLEHAFALIKLCENEELPEDKVFFHAFTDGRDSSPTSSKVYLEQIEGELKRRGVGRIASVMGRYYAMDRDTRWERTEKAYDALVMGKGNLLKDWRDGIDRSYAEKRTDEFIEPIVITEDGTNPITKIASGDAVIFFNYRADRAKQITRAFIQDDFEYFERGPKLQNLVYVGMTLYDKNFKMLAAFPPENVQMTMGRLMSDNGYRQLRIAESEKFPHVTYFFNGGILEQFPGEDRIEIPSPKVATYDKMPEMSAYKVTETLTERIMMDIYDFILVNLANGDMVGHTGVIDAGVKAVEVVDECLGKIVNAALLKGGEVFVTADHGNCEQMINLQTGEVDTEHTTNPVPFLHITNNPNPRELSFGILSDIVPTMLSRMGVQKPSIMTGRNLLSQA